MTTITNGNGYPIFEPNQVLTNTDLNRIVSYLDHQNRLTRSHLIGMGILCGLTVVSTVTDTSIEIRVTPGCGITSEGYFIYHAPASDGSDRPFTHFHDILLPREAFGLPADSQQSQVRARELLITPTAAAETTLPLTVIGDLSQQVVAVLCDWEDTPRDSCLVDCDDRGRDRQFRLRFLLLHREAFGDDQTNGWLDATTLLRTGYSVPSNQTLVSYFQSWYDVPDCTMPRFGYYPAPSTTESDGVDLSRLVTIDQFKTAYYQVCQDAIDRIDRAFTAIHQLFSPFLDRWHPNTSELTTLKPRLTAHLDGLLGRDSDTAVSPLPSYGIQYFYDYLTDLIAAYGELKDGLFDVMADCMPDLNRFPKYLLLGEAAGASAVCARPSLYRHAFTQPPIYNGNAQRLNDVRHRFTRLLTMSREFAFLPFYQTPVKITPSRSRAAALGEQAIPYYLSYPDLLPYWNYDACRKLRTNRVPAYFRPLGLPNSRGYDLRDRLDAFDFFRLEGHVGLPLMAAIDRIKGYEQDFNLAFDLVAVRLGNGIDEPGLLEGYFDDLEVEFDQIKANWQKKYEYAKRTISNRRINQILDKFHELFFKHEDLAKIDPGLMENEFLKQVRDPNNYEFELLNPTASHYRLGLNFRSTPARIALVTDETLTGTQIQRVKVFTLADADHRNQNQQRIIETFVNNFLVYPSTLQVEADNEVFRFILKDGQENIELVGSDADLTAMLLRLEDETPYSANGLFDRYHDFDALFTFLKYFGGIGEGERGAILSAEDAAILVSYYEFRALFRRYLLRLESVKKMQLFQEYAKQHRGLEHLGGVPKGGTFVLVYTSDPTMISSLIASDSALSSLSDQQVKTIKAQAQVPPGGLAVGDRGKAISSDRLGQNVVIADFCLPYRCCSAYSSLNYVMAQPKPFISLPQPVYCEGDAKIYDFILDPPGGLLRGGDGIVDHNGTYAFQPSTVDADVTEPMNLTFFYIVDGVSSSYSILLLPHVEIQFSIASTRSPICVLPNEPKLIDLQATPAGGQFQLSIEDGSAQNITVNNNQFDLGSLPFPTGKNVLTLRFFYTVPNTDDYCGGTSDPQELVVIRQPKAQIEYQKNDVGQAIGTLVYDPKNCSDLRWRVEFGNQGSEAETYEWQLKGKKVAGADSRNMTLDIPYTPSKLAKVTLIARNQNAATKTTCSDTDSINVVLPQLDPFWTFNSKLPARPGNPETIILYRNGNPEPLTVKQPGGTFSSKPTGLTVSLSDAALPCDQRTGYVMDFAKAKVGIYTLTYTLPDGSNFSRQIEVVAPYGYGDMRALAIGGNLIASWEDK